MRPTPINDLLLHASLVEGHVAIHANFTPTSTRHPQPDWSVQVLWIARNADGQSEPASLYGTGADLAEASQAALDLIPDPTQEPPHEQLDA